MRILHVSSEHPPIPVFGLGRYVCDLSRELARQGHEVHVLTNSPGPAMQDRIDRGVSIHCVDYPPPPKPGSHGAPVMAFNLHLQERAATLGPAGLGGPEVVVSHDWLTALAAHRIARWWGVPHVWTVHDTVFGKRAGKIDDQQDLLAFEIESWATREADLVLVNSAAIHHEIVSAYGGDPARMGLLHCGIDPANFESIQSPSRLEAFRELFASRDELLITYCGRLDIEKGIDTLINAFGIVKSKGVPARLAIAGSGRLQGMIEEHIRRLHLADSVRLYGYVEGQVLTHFYKASDIHICPSHYEPFGLVAAEAMAAGTAVIASATGGLTDIVTSLEVGRLVPPRDVGALAAAIEELALQPEKRRRLGEAGLEHVRRNFSWSVLARKALEHYSSSRAKKEAVA